jgi:diguanylate cyclase (GGDEF)-like protein
MTKTPSEALLAKLQRANLQLALSTLVVVSVTLIVISFLTLRIYVDQNLSLVGRSIADTVQAAVVFRDRAAAQEILAVIGEREGLPEIELHDMQGRPLAHYLRQQRSGLQQRLSALGTLMLPHKASADILHEGVKVGRVSLLADFSVYVRFFLQAIVAILFALGIVLLLCRSLLRKFDHDIVKPLEQLASLTREARVDRRLAIRAPQASVLEINALGEDFNALMGEIQAHERKLLNRQDTLEEANEVLAQQVLHDGLTGLPNRTCFDARLAEALQSAELNRDMLAVMFIDCDHFKQINDTQGHAAGDEVLMEFARRMKAQLRDVDTVARLGGDEFAVMLAPVRNDQDARLVAAKMVDVLAAPIWTRAAGLVQASATIGVALFPTHGRTRNALLECADAIMYRAKKQQRGTFSVAQDCDVQAARESKGELTGV